MDRYEKMARIIRYLDENFQEQPDLEKLARLSGMSPTHFHREFSRWIGVSPKDFVQGLTHAFARDRLEQGASVLDAALDSGLSGPSRLHDLCLTIDAMTPGTLKARGEGLCFRYGTVSSPFGTCFYAETERGITRFEFLADHSPPPEQVLREEWPLATLRRDQARAKAIIRRVFQPPPRASSPLPLKLWLRGSQFQYKVWRALLQLDRGSLTTYQRLGVHVGLPNGARAIGNAVGSNPVAVLIPCHRVIRSTGIIQGYRWGTGRKRALVAWESVSSVGR